jgi:hypothetical protein
VPAAFVVGVAVNVTGVEVVGWLGDAATATLIHAPTATVTVVECVGEPVESAPVTVIG